MERCGHYERRAVEVNNIVRQTKPQWFCEQALRSEQRNKDSLAGAEGCYLPTALPVMARAAGESFIGNLKRRMPSYLYNALATAGAVGTKPISPTPFAP